MPTEADAIIMPDGRSTNALAGGEMAGGFMSEFIDIFRRLDTSTRLTVIRIMLTPSIYLLFFIIITMLYYIEARVVYTITLSMILLLTPLNALLWVVTDVHCMNNYSRLFREGKYNSGEDEEEDRLSDLADVVGSNHQSDMLEGSVQEDANGNISNRGMSTSFSVINPINSNTANNKNQSSQSPTPILNNNNNSPTPAQHKSISGLKQPTDNTELLL